MRRGVPWRGNYKNFFVRENRRALRKRPDGAILELKHFGLPPFRPAVRQVAVQTTHQPLGTVQLRFVNPRPTANHVPQSARVIGMQMGKSDGMYIPCSYA